VFISALAGSTVRSIPNPRCARDAGLGVPHKQEPMSISAKIFVFRTKLLTSVLSSHRACSSDGQRATHGIRVGTADRGVSESSGRGRLSGRAGADCACSSAARERRGDCRKNDRSQAATRAPLAQQSCEICACDAAAALRTAIRVSSLRAATSRPKEASSNRDCGVTRQATSHVLPCTFPLPSLHAHD
jgi:hypothetical protein